MEIAITIVVLVVALILLPMGIAYGVSAVVRHFWKDKKYLKSLTRNIAVLCYFGFIVWVSFTIYASRTLRSRIKTPSKPLNWEGNYMTSGFSFRESIDKQDDQKRRYKSIYLLKKDGKVSDDLYNAVVNDLPVEP